jgi:hypothetical protein
MITSVLFGAAMRNDNVAFAAQSKRANCRGVCAKRLSSVLAAASTATPVKKSLRAAFKKESIQQQQDHGADNRHDPAGNVVPARKDATNPGAYKGAGYTEQNCYDATTGVFPRHQQFCDRTDNKTNKQGPNN